jgi:hypothetical protein
MFKQTLLKSLMGGQMWWYTPVISATEEIEMGGSCISRPACPYHKKQAGHDETHL